MLAEQLAYYRARAPGYDQSYQRTGPYDRGPETNAAWHAELSVVEAAFDACDLSGHVLELGCGTGVWSERLARRASAVSALDAAPEMIERARRRVGATGDVRFQVVDIVSAWTPDRLWDAMVACFFLEHVPDRHLPHLLAKVAAALRPGAAVFVVDGLYQGSDAEVEERELGGRRYRVVERRRPPRDVEAAFGAAGMSLTVEPTGSRFCVGVGRRSPDG